jgi:hypothetical protein
MARPAATLVIQPQAEWRLNPVTERAIAEERRSFLQRRWVLGALGTFSLGLCPLAIFVRTYSLFGVTIGEWPFVAVLLSMIALSHESVRRSTRYGQIRRRRKLAIRDEYGEIDGWQVDMTVFQGAAPTGHDRGMVWIEDGRLYFVGERTSFGLSPSQVSITGARSLSHEPALADIQLPLDRTTAGGNLSVGLQVVPTDSGEFSAHNRQDQCRLAIKSWVKSGDSGEGQLPPLTIGPSMPGTLRLFWMAVTATAFWSGLTVIVLLIGLTASWWTVFPVLFTIGLIATLWWDVWSPRIRWLAWRDRRRFDRSEA